MVAENSAWKWFSVTRHDDGATVHVNARSVQYLAPGSGNRCLIVFGQAYYLEVSESVEDVRQRIEN